MASCRELLPIDMKFLCQIWIIQTITHYVIIELNVPIKIDDTSTFAAPISKINPDIGGRAIIHC